jgi:hypothetical protein
LAGGKWAALEAVVGTAKRIRLVVQDLVTHFERWLEAMDGKAPGQRRHNSIYRH